MNRALASDETEERALLAEGRNCWKIRRAERLAFLIDAEAYFSAFAAAVERARESIIILAWDFDSRIPLLSAGSPGRATRLGDFLNRAVARRRRLHAHILDWDFAMLYALEREPPPVFGLGWRPHRKVEVGIARTDPTLGVREIETLSIDSIRAARRAIYIETQYLTSASVGDALAERLSEPDGPDIVVVTRSREEGWLEAKTMGALKARTIGRLSAADRFGRFRVYFPTARGLEGSLLNVHSKVMVVDDVLARVGSANLNNRSMGFDCECDIAVEARGDPKARRAIAAFRDRLLAEHLDVRPEEVAEATAALGSLAEAVDRLRGKPRTLAPLAIEVGGNSSALLPLAALADAERPVTLDELIREFVPEGMREPAGFSLLGLALSVLALMLVGAAWQWGPLRSWLDLEQALGWALSLRERPAGPLIVIGAYIAGSLVVFPRPFLTLATVLAFGPWWGVLYALAGTLSAAALTFGLGGWIGRDALRRCAGARLNQLSALLRRKGVAAIVTVRVLPLAPFAVVNMVAGAMRIRFGHFMLGSLIGVLPGTLMTALFADSLTRAMRNPHPENVLLLAAVAAFGLLSLVWLGRAVARRTPGVGKRREGR